MAFYTKVIKDAGIGEVARHQASTDVMPGHGRAYVPAHPCL